MTTEQNAIAAVLALRLALFFWGAAWVFLWSVVLRWAACRALDIDGTLFAVGVVHWFALWVTVWAWWRVVASVNRG